MVLVLVLWERGYFHKSKGGNGNCLHQHSDARLPVMGDQRLEICYHLRIPPPVGVCMPPMFPHMKILEVDWQRTCPPKYKLPLIIPSAIIYLPERPYDPGAFFLLNNRSVSTLPPVTRTRGPNRATRPWKCFAEGGRGGAWWRWGIDRASILRTCTPPASNTSLQVSQDFELVQLNTQLYSYLK